MKSLAEAKQFIKDNNVKYILAQFVDIHGSSKTKSVPAAHLEGILSGGAGFAGFAVWGLGMGPHGPDYMAVGDLPTLKLIPWMPGYANLTCDGHVNGQPYEYDSRVVLKKAVARLAERGWTLNTGIEPEFMLLKKDANGNVHPFDASDDLEKPCYDYKGLARGGVFLEQLVDSLIASGFDVYQADHEDANGQFEINYTYADCLTSADQLVFFKMAASEIAHKLGMVCTFMPKPFPNRTGSGMHYHLSISSKENKNLFYDKTDSRGMGLSRLGYQFLAGILHHAPALTAIAAPTVNSYKRLVVGRALSGATWAPAYIAYGDNNRTCMVRIPYGRLEMRLPDGSSNPYLVTAAIIAAGLDGIERDLDPGEPINQNLYEWSTAQLNKAKVRVLPQSLKNSLDALEKDKVILGALGESLSKEFLNIKHMEWVEYQRHVSDWEVKRYLEFF